MRGREAVLTALALVAVLAISLSYANVFVYYPVSASLNPVSPPVYFDLGSNAGKPDLGVNNNIQVQRGLGNASLIITVHPTYQTTYYKNISIVVNSDTKSYYLYFRIVQAFSLPSGSSAQLCVYKSNGARSLTGIPPNPPTPGGADLIQCVSLTSTGTSSAITLIVNTKVELDLYIYIPETTTVPSSTTAQIYLIYTPTAESPP